MPPSIPRSSQPEPWDSRIRRADQLAAEAGPSASLLAFYAGLLRSQKTVYQALQSQQPSGALEKDVAFVRASAPALLREVANHGSDQLGNEARALLTTNPSALDALLLAYWYAPTDRQFFAKAILQPYGQWLAEAGVRPSDRAATHVDNRCPACGGTPQLSILEAASAGAAGIDGGSRRLLCAGCLCSWPFRRVICPSCGEGDEQHLVYYQTAQLEHVRVDACETCRRYLKSIDLTRLGLAVPLVDEVAGAPLDLWAQEHGYEKIELNLVGL
jgi:FdhE protein